MRATIKLKTLLLLCLPIFLFLLVSLIRGATYTYSPTDSDFGVLVTYVRPLNNSQSFTFANMTTLTNLTITLNVSYLNCKYTINLNGTYYSMVNKTVDNVTYENASAMPESLFSGASIHNGSVKEGTWRYSNISFYCYNGSNNVTWTNASLYRVGFKDAVYKITVPTPGGTPVNNTAYERLAGYNISINDTPRLCHSFTDGVNVTNMVDMNMSGDRNLSWNGTSLWNGSANVLTDNIWHYDDGPDEFHNVTFRCEDAFGNYSWSNTTNTWNATTGWANNYTFFRIDRDNPVTYSEVFTIGNYTSGGNYLNVTFNITDNSTLGCKVNVWMEDGRVFNVTGGDNSINTSVQHPFCYINITPDDIDWDGYADVTPVGIDEVFHEGNGSSSQNASVIFFRLKEGWNLLAGFENKTLSEIADEFPNVSYVSVRENAYGWKNYTTYTVGLTTNANYPVNATNATYVYVTEDLDIVRNYVAPLVDGYNMTIWSNLTTATAGLASTSGWNQVGMITHNHTMNATLWDSDACEMVNDSAQPTLIVPNCNNITWMCYDSPTIGYCCGHRDRLALSCSGYTTANLSVPRGAGVWVWTNDNITIQKNIWG